MLDAAHPPHHLPRMSILVPARSEVGGSLKWPCLACSVAMLAWTLSLARRANPWTFLDWVNLRFHEAGHLFLLPFGETLHFLGGTIFQLAIPIGVMIHFLWKRRPFSAATCFWWLGQNLLGIAVYMADARDLNLPLVGGGENDWNHLFYQWGLLGEGSVKAISATAHSLGVVLMMLACLWMAFLALPAARQASLTGELTRRLPFLPGFRSPGE